MRACPLIACWRWAGFRAFRPYVGGVEDPGLMTYQPADPLDPPMVEVLEDDQWWDGVVQAQEQRDGAWWVHVVYRRNGNRVGWFPADRVRADQTDYSRGRTVGGE